MAVCKPHSHSQEPGSKGAKSEGWIPAIPVQGRGCALGYWSQTPSRVHSHSSDTSWVTLGKCVCVRAQLLSHAWLFATLWLVACQVPLSMGFSRQEYWSRLPFPIPGNLPDLGYILFINLHFLIYKVIMEKNEMCCACITTKNHQILHYEVIKCKLSENSIFSLQPIPRSQLLTNLRRCQLWWSHCSLVPLQNFPD